MYNVELRKKLFFDEMKQNCCDCGFRMKCEDMTNSEVDKCFRYFIEKKKVIPLLIKNNMNIDEWTCYGKMSIDSLVHLYLYLKYEDTDSSRDV